MVNLHNKGTIAFVAVLGRVLVTLDQIPPEDRASQWVLDSLIDELGPIGIDSTLKQSDMQTFRSLRDQLARQVQNWKWFDENRPQNP